MIKTPQTAHIQPHPFNPSNDRQVRGVCACDLGILPSSRDKTAKVWAEEKEAGGRGFALLTTLVGHTGYVGPVAFIAPGARDDLPNGAVVTGALPGRAMMRGAANGPPVPLSPQQQSVRAPSDPHPTPLSLSTPLPCTHTHTHTHNTKQARSTRPCACGTPWPRASSPCSRATSTRSRRSRCSRAARSRRRRSTSESPPAAVIMGG